MAIKSTRSTPITPTIPTESSAQWLASHGSDPSAIDDRFSADAQAACASGADDYLKSITSYEYKWDDDAKGWLGIKFNMFSSKSAGVGLLTLLTNRVELSNAFGAFHHASFYCL